jgi:hypothetical protein
MLFDFNSQVLKIKFRITVMEVVLSKVEQAVGIMAAC